MILGLSTFAYGWSFGANGQAPVMDVFDLIKLASGSGLYCLQLGDNCPVHLFSEKNLYALKKATDDHNIRLEVGARMLTPDHLNHYIQIAASLGSPLLRFVVDGSDYEPKEKDIVATIRNVLPKLKKQNITLGIENHDRFRAEELGKIMDAISDENVGICLDTVNSIGAGEGLDWVTTILAPYTVNLHIKEFSIKRFSHNMGFAVSGAPAGEGMMNLHSIMRALEKSGRCQSAVLEQWVPEQSTHSNTVALERSWADRSIEYLKGLPFF